VRVIVNGEPHELNDGLTVAGLISQLSLNGHRIAVELNREILDREAWVERQLAAEDEVEIVHFVGGG